ncbi:hypothetical protein BEL04_06510 [Mucilaginibacter sp. PPCGB 2223]|uniref:O-antigen ligase family protein n=1 Tax=Mucilaginibacter sp. PPCGB 2223 TaxID=1886027 RepID=UPI0008589325|nr:O-antigen ligase family protein [Mucilaginibacter sp. PPCGB 2223]OCX53927.1 hypothetical protein BEL04_06510 [Mucilaginibacter sp. PPCGB 2223]
MMKSIKKEAIENYAEYILAIFAVYANGSWLFFEYTNAVKIGLDLFLLLYLFFQVKITKTIAVPNAIVFFLAVFPLISKIFNVSFDLFNTFSIMIVYFILGFYNKKTLLSILDKFAQVIYYLSIISIVFGILFLINYSWITLLPTHTNDLFGGADTGGYYNLLVYTDRVSNDLRVQSIFWEPGAWAFNQLFAFYWFLFYKRNNKVLIVFLVSILLTVSTSGFIMVLLLALQIFLFSDDRVLKKRFGICLISLVSLLVLGSVYLASATDLDIGNMIYIQTIDKLFTHENTLAAGSVNDRAEITLKAFNIALDHPIFGISRQSAENMLQVTSSISEVSYQLGFLYLFVFMYLFRMVFKKLNWFISILFIIVLLNGEAYAGGILCSFILIYGAKETRWAEVLSFKKPIAAVYHINS